MHTLHSIRRSPSGSSQDVQPSTINHDQPAHPLPPSPPSPLSPHSGTATPRQDSDCDHGERDKEKDKDNSRTSFGSRFTSVLSSLFTLGDSSSSDTEDMDPTATAMAGLKLDPAAANGGSPSAPVGPPGPLMTTPTTNPTSPSPSTTPSTPLSPHQVQSPTALVAHNIVTPDRSPQLKPAPLVPGALTPPLLKPARTAGLGIGRTQSLGRNVGLAKGNVAPVPRQNQHTQHGPTQPQHGDYGYRSKHGTALPPPPPAGGEYPSITLSSPATPVVSKTKNPFLSNSNSNSNSPDRDPSPYSPPHNGGGGGGGGGGLLVSIDSDHPPHRDGHKRDSPKHERTPKQDKLLYEKPPRSPTRAVSMTTPRTHVRPLPQPPTTLVRTSTVLDHKRDREKRGGENGGDRPATTRKARAAERETWETCYCGICVRARRQERELLQMEQAKENSLSSLLFSR
ncbi:uncharacterized protein EHS24_006030 [Apiotrichum porosum]|uniref:Uncharacterized protein n=1 Tax=Apiotrichum porosum TaxID=105984 RepID=A0A427Y066_9TREE|nr:uncharacterized protein EHS24_006030 [Apiotrichum porosum]RSH84508.1 hypothetical protein EHS24_006030 [Apiotrichum porosum]